MKLKHILLTVLAAGLAFVGCQDSIKIASLEGVKLSSSVAGFPVEGGTTTITINSDCAWQINTAAKAIPEWLKIDPLSASAGETTINLTAEENKGPQITDEIFIKFENAKTQVIKLIQNGGDPEPSTCKDVIEGADGKVFKVTGTITSIANTHYGNIYINDGTGEVYIYGTRDKKGNTNKSENSYDNINDPSFTNAWELAIGDQITVYGPRTTYKGTIELVDVTIEKIVKSLLTIESEREVKVDKDANDVEIKLTYKGDDIKVKTDAPWLTLADVNVGKDTTFVKIHVDANTEDGRKANVIISSSQKDQTTEASVVITQASGLEMYTLPFAETFAENQGEFEIIDITPLADDKAIWSFASGYGMKASANVSKVNYEGKSMLISPKISLAGAVSPVLTFEHTGKYCGDQAEEFTLWVSTDNCQTWTQLLIPSVHNNDWTFVPSGDISLARFVDADYINFAFQYSSTTDNAGTYEVKNVMVEDRALVLTNLAGLSNAATSDKVERTVNLTDAIVAYADANNAFIQDATGAVQLYIKTGHDLEVGDVFNGDVKFELTLYNGYQEATAIDYSAATKTKGEVTPIVLTVDKLNKAYTRYTCCYVKIEGATFATGSEGNDRVNDTMSQGEASVATRTQDKTIAYAAATPYDVLCIPVRYNGAPQVSIYVAPTAAE